MNTVENIWDAYRSKLLAFIRKRVHNEDAEDILQDVFVKIQCNIDKLKEKQKIESWLYQITRNTIIDHYRSRKDLSILPEWLETKHDEIPEEEGQELMSCFLPMIQHLPEKYRNALVLSELEGKTQQALAEEENISLSGAKSRVQRGRSMLKDLLLDCCTFYTDQHSGNTSCERKQDSCNTC